MSLKVSDEELEKLVEDFILAHYTYDAGDLCDYLKKEGVTFLKKAELRKLIREYPYFDEFWFEKVKELLG